MDQYFQDYQEDNYKHNLQFVDNKQNELQEIQKYSTTETESDTESDTKIYKFDNNNKMGGFWCVMLILIIVLLYIYFNYYSTNN